MRSPASPRSSARSTKPARSSADRTGHRGTSFCGSFPMTAFQAIFTAILQGITELFPVSSLGHAVVLPALLGWQIDQHSPSFLPFLVVLHLGTAAALLIYFWRDWIQLLLAVLGRPTERPRREELRLLGLIVVATIPAGIVGPAFPEKLRGLFGLPTIPGRFLLVTG